MSKRRPKRMKRSYLKRWSSAAVKVERFTPEIMSLAHGNPRGSDEVAIVDQEGKLKAYREFVDPVSVERKRVLRTLEVWQSDFRQGFGEYSFIVVHGRHYQSLKRYFCGDRIFFIRETKDSIERSITYPTKQLAMLAFTKGRITWVEFQSKHDPPVASD